MDVLTNIITLSGDKLPTFAKVSVDLIFKNNKYKTIFYVIKMNCNNIIGLDLAIKLNLINRINAIAYDNIFEKYSEMFDG